MVKQIYHQPRVNRAKSIVAKRARSDGKSMISLPTPRVGWAEDAKDIATHDEPLAWPEFGNDWDDDLVW